MNDKIKTWLYIVGSILVIGIVGYLAISLLVYLIPVLVVIYIIFKVKGYIDRRKSTNSNSQYANQYKSTYESKISDMDNTTGEVIDVEYEDVNK